MNDDNQKTQMAENWERVPLTQAVVASWVIIKHGVPTGADKRDLILELEIAEAHGINWLQKQLGKIAPANHYVIMPPDSSGAGLRVRFSRHLVSVIGNSRAAHLARLVEANMISSSISFSTALKVVIQSHDELLKRNIGLDRSALAERVILDGAIQILRESLMSAPAYVSDVSAGLVDGCLIRSFKHVPGALAEVAVSTPSGAQRWYKVDLDEMSSMVLHGEMSGMVTDYPLTPTLEFPLSHKAYSVMFLHERQEVRLTVNWDEQSHISDSWSNKLLFR